MEQLKKQGIDAGAAHAVRLNLPHDFSDDCLVGCGVFSRRIRGLRFDYIGQSAFGHKSFACPVAGGLAFARRSTG